MARTIKHGDTWFIDDDNYDYSVEIQKAVDAGDFAKAAYLEKSRNAKIDRFVMPYEKTYLYQDYLPKVGKAADSVSGTSTTQVPSIGDSDYAKRMNSTLNKLGAMNFHYNANNDPLYKQIKQNYKNTADDVIENTMGSYAGMTGGVPSSYAVSAATQAGAQHMQRADDMIPALYELAYNKFAQDKADLYKQYDIMADIEEQAYNRQYQLGRDKVADEQYADEVAWEQQVYRDEQARTDANEAKSTANAQITNSLLMGIPPSDELIAASSAYAPGTTGQMILDTFQKDEKKQEAAERVSNAFLMGVPPKEEDLALLNYPEGITGEAALAAYKAANAPKVTGSSGGSAKAKELKRPTTAMFDAIDKLFEEGDGIGGLDRLLSRYDWDEYNREEIDDYIKTYYSDVDGVSEYFYEPSFAEKYADKINTAFKKKNGDKYSALKANGDGTYSLSDAESAYIIKAVFEDDSLTQDEAESLLYDYFRITEKQVQDMLNDRHYR